MGGGIGCWGASSPLIVNNLILNNSTGNDGGNISLYYVSSSNLKIVNNTISDNERDGISIVHCNFSNISNNIVVNNTGVGIWATGYYGQGISHNDIWNNTGGNFFGCPAGVGDTTWGTNVNETPCDSFHNIIRDPMFVNPDTDYHLQENSPCMNAGDKYISGLPDFDFDFKPRIRGCRVDMGVYEYDYQYEYTCGDANGDHKVTVSDAVYLVNYLFKGGQTPIPIQSGDANCDGKVTVSDVVYLVNYLFKGGPPPC